MTKQRFHLLLLPLDVLGIAFLVGVLIEEVALWLPAFIGAMIYGAWFLIQLRRQPPER